MSGGPDHHGVTGTGLPDTPAGAQMAWVLTQGAAADDASVARRFSAGFLARVPAERLGAVLEDLGALRVVDAHASGPTRLEATMVTADGTALASAITVEEVEPHRITGLLFQPAERPAAPGSWTEAAQRSAALAPQVSLLAAEVAGDGSLRTVHEHQVDASGPIGSVCKLYVLGALAVAAGAGDIGWDDNLAIEERDRSLPSSRLHAKVGSTVSVREAARLMMAISDNTATDLLIRRLSRRAVEAVLEPMGLGPASRARTLPFLTTRQMTILKWGAGPDTLAAYAGAAEDQRRRLLEDLPAELPSAGTAGPSRPVEIDRVEWFASARELAAAHLSLDAWRTRAGLEPLDDVLRANPGLPLDAVTWPRVAFKGGSEPGVLALSWLLERCDGRRFVLALLAADTARPIDDLEGSAIAAGAIALLATPG